MTAINAFIRGKEVHVLTDAAYLEATGRLVFIGSKIGLLPHVNAVCVTRGEGEIDAAFRAMLGTAFTSFDALTSGFRQAVQTVIAAALLGQKQDWPFLRAALAAQAVAQIVAGGVGE
mgnify:CR=1 FL=1